MFITLNNRLNEAPEQFNVRLIKRIYENTEPGGSYVVMEGGAVQVTETPAEIMALVAAEERKQQRREIAAQALKGILTNLTYTAEAQHTDEIAGKAVKFADALLAALDAREGE